MKPFRIKSKSSLDSAIISIINEIIEPTYPYNTIKDKTYYLHLRDEIKYKTKQQNKLFHSLLQAFWESNCSSFLSYDELRNHYKRLAGLIELKYINPLSQETKAMLWKAIKILPIEEKEKLKIYDLLKGKMEYCRSWSEVSNDNATFAIQQLRNDCIRSGAYNSSPKVKAIIEEMDEGQVSTPERC
jgi:hypothetical protein